MTTATAVVLPQEILDLRARLASSNIIERCDAAAEFAGVPTYDDFPRPGEAAHWSHRDWADWAKEAGFNVDHTEVGRLLIQHRMMPNARVAISEGGEWRSNMNGMAELRRAWTGAHDTFARSLAFAIDGILSGRYANPCVGALKPLRAFIDWLGNERDALKRDLDEQGKEASHTLISEADRLAADEAPKVLRTLREEAKMGLREALAGAAESLMTAQEFDILCKRFGSSTKVVPFPGCAIVVQQIRDVISVFRESARAEKEAKRREREAERAAKDLAKMPGSKEFHDRQEREARAALLRGQDDIDHHLKALMQAVNRQRGAIDSVKMPDYPAEQAAAIEAGKEAQAKLAELEKRLAAVAAEQATLSAQLAQAQEAVEIASRSAIEARNEADRALADKLAAEELLAGDTWKRTALDFATRVLAALKSGDAIDLLNGLTTVRTEAQAVLKRAEA